MDARHVWSDEAKNRLRALWNEQLSSAAIGVAMGYSKNAIVGQAHRMKLPARPSPIVRTGVRVRGAIKRAPKQTLPMSAGAPCPPPATPHAAPTPSVAPTAVPPAPRIATSSRHVTTCCWPLGEPGTRAFRFCDAAATGRSYCDTHAALAYIKPRDSRECAA